MREKYCSKNIKHFKWLREELILILIDLGTHDNLNRLA